MSKINKYQSLAGHVWTLHSSQKPQNQHQHSNLGTHQHQSFMDSCFPFNV
jgi:hypothetical protein